MKKITAIILCIVLAFSAGTVAFARGVDGECECGFVPVIYVTGFAQTNLVADAGTENERQVFFPEVGAILKCVAKILLPAAALVVTGDYGKFEKSLAAAVNELFADVACDADGVPLNDTVDIAIRDLPSASHSAYTLNYFRYDWREDVFDIAEELNEFIEKTKLLTGHDKVALKAESMGGAVVMTYIHKYGSESIDTLVMQSSAYRGITLVGGMFNGDIEIKGSSVLNYIGNFLEGNSPDMVIYRTLLMTLGKVIVNPLARVIDKMFDNIGGDLYDDSLKSTLGWIPGVWTFVPYEEYESAKAFMLNEEINASLIEKIDRYQYNVAPYTKQLLDGAIAKGMKFCIVSHYGKAGVPATSDDSFESDFLIDTKRTSFGATCADFGSTLGDGYIQKLDASHNHLSCDGIIDASTCAYPEQTWFIKDMMHTWYTRDYLRFVYELIYCDVQPTIETFARYPQFLCNNHDTGALEILSESNMNTTSTDIVSAVKDLIKK